MKVIKYDDFIKGLEDSSREEKIAKAGIKIALRKGKTNEARHIARSLILSRFEEAWPYEEAIEKELKKAGYKKASHLREIASGNRFKNGNFYAKVERVEGKRGTNFLLFPATISAWFNAVMDKGGYIKTDYGVSYYESPDEVFRVFGVYINQPIDPSKKIVVLIQGPHRPGKGNDFLKYVNSADAAVKLVERMTKKLRELPVEASTRTAKTYAKAKEEILAYLEKEGWKVKKHLKIPQAISPRREILPKLGKDLYAKAKDEAKKIKEKAEAEKEEKSE